jgi:hypothetical protein
MGSSRHLSLVPAPAAAGREPLRRLLLSAVLETPTNRYLVVVRDLTSDIAVVHGERLPRKGALVCLRRGLSEAYGEVAWVEGDEATIEFEEFVDGAQFRSGGVKQLVPIDQPYRRPGLNRGSCGDVSDGSGSLAAGGVWRPERRSLSDL